MFPGNSQEASISSKLQVYENICECLSFSVIAKADFWNNVHLQIFSLVESCFIEIRVLRVLLPVTLQKELKLVLCASSHTLQRYIKTQHKHLRWSLYRK